VLVAGVLKLDPQGRVILSTLPPLYFNGGTPIAADGGLSSLAGGTPDVYLGGIGYTAPAKLTDSNNPLIAPGGPVTNRDGQLRISTAPPTQWYAGLPLTAEGFLSVSDGGPPPEGPGAYDQGFSNAFDNGSP